MSSPCGNLWSMREFGACSVRDETGDVVHFRKRLSGKVKTPFWVRGRG